MKSLLIFALLFYQERLSVLFCFREVNPFNGFIKVFTYNIFDFIKSYFKKLFASIDFIYFSVFKMIM